MPLIRIAGIIFPGFIIWERMMQARRRWIGLIIVFILAVIVLICAFKDAFFFGRYLDQNWLVLHKWIRYPMYLQWYMPYRVADSFFGWILSLGFLGALIIHGKRDLYVNILTKWIIFYCQHHILLISN